MEYFFGLYIFSFYNLLLLIQDRDLIFLIQVFLSIRWLRLELNQKVQNLTL